MKFKEYLNEYIKNSTMKEWTLMLSAKMPVKPGYLYEEPKRTTVYRIAGEDSIKDIKKYEGKKGLWSGFTVGSKGIANGIFSGGAYIWELDANVQLESSLDAYTTLDRNGYKWVESKAFELKIMPLMKEYFVKEIKTYNSKITIQNISKMDMLLHLKEKDKDGKKRRVQKFVKWYYGVSKDIMKKYKNDIIKYFKDQIPISKNDYYKNDEIIFNEYRIKGAYIVSDDFKKDFIQGIKDLVDFAMSPSDIPIIHHYEELKKSDIPFLGFIYKEQITKIDPKHPASKYKFDIDMNEVIREVQSKIDFINKINNIT